MEGTAHNFEEGIRIETDGKVRLLRILELLQQETDADHPITISQIEQLLSERYGITAYRITIQKDISALRSAGYEIEVNKTNRNSYYYEGQLFELPELKLLIDAVESSKFITEKKSRVLAQKLISMATKHQQHNLRRNNSISDRIKPHNEQVYYILDVLNDAINVGKKVSFFYYEYSPQKEKKIKNCGKAYIFSPYTLTWNGDYYYVVGFSEKHQKIATFRVDRILKLPIILQEAATPKPESYNIADFSEKAFQLFDWERTTVSLLCRNHTMNSVMDHFGEKASIMVIDEQHFRIRQEVAPSPTFFAWVFQFGGAIVIEEPDSVRKQYHTLLKSAWNTLHCP